ncbi:mo-molybdopterin cofactor sulfurase isoform X1 [Zea mays]|nr:mo-molybdopterin cofactor sulfurase isoform X1 [Zea mays]
MPPPPTAVSSCWRGTRRHRAKNLHPHPAAVSVKQPGSGVRFQQFSSLASAAAPALRVLRYQPASTLYESPSSTPPRQLQAMAMEKAASFLSSLLGGGGGEPAATVKSIFIYPIKSCRGLAVSQAPITSTGFRWDRQWVVVNAKGRAYTQRVEPKLALVQVELPPEAFAENWQPTPDDHLVIRAPGMDTLKIPLITEHTTIDDVSVWEWSGSAYDEGAEASEWFSTYFGKPSRLVRFKEASETRPTDPDYAQGYKIMFTDCFPFLIASQGSLDALNEILKEPVPMNRFRPNILVDGCHPYSEDLWKTIKINNLTFLGVKLCNRCKVPTINQEDGVPGTEPTETLQTFRSDQVLRPSHKNKRQVYFGQNLVCKESLSGEGKVIKVGDPVYVVQAFASSNEAPA